MDTPECPIVHASEYLLSIPKFYAKPGLSAAPVDAPGFNLAWIQVPLELTRPPTFHVPIGAA
jgi:hypothetical protein